jgi:hypothetical protein
VAAVTLSPGCATNPSDAISEGIAGAINGMEDWFGGGDLPSEHLEDLRALHQPGTWKLRTDVPGALEDARDALRALGEADYSTWRDAGIVTQVVSSIAIDHTAGLMRIEALDTLARVGPWTIDAAQPPEIDATEEDVIDALKIVRLAQGKKDTDPLLTAQVLHAVKILGSFKFDSGAPLPEDISLRIAARRHGSKLRNARGVLLAFTGSTLEGFRADPDISAAMDRAYVSLSGAVIRATFVTSLTGDKKPTVRATAGRHIGTLRLEGGAIELSRSLEEDLSSSVRRASVTALGRYPPEVAVPGLIEGLYDDMPEVRGSASRALAASTGQNFGNDRGAWRRWWQQASRTKPASGTPSE